MELEITRELKLSTQQKVLLDQHSFVNIINVLLGELRYIKMLFKEHPLLDTAYGIALQIQNQLGKETLFALNGWQFFRMKEGIFGIIEQLKTLYPQKAHDKDLKESLENLQSVFAILELQLYEMLARQSDPDKWQWYDINTLQRNFSNVFKAIEKNSRGSYRIVFYPHEQTNNDYLLELTFSAADQNRIYMPIVLQDVLRDLLANARKYTRPGGHIIGSLVDDGIRLSLLVRDNGEGIPAEELATVVEFGRRGSNVQDKPAMGGGFGLTKAYYVTRQFGGRMWIESEVGKGTQVTIIIPSKPGR